MKLTDTIIFSLAIVFFIIGVHQSMTVGFEYSYWLFMFAIGLLLWYNMRKNKNKRESSGKSKPSDKKPKK